MKKYLIIIVALIYVFNDAEACTTFIINDSEHLLFCRNYDYDLGEGFVVINKRGLAKHSLVSPPYQPVRWVSKYGSITFNQIGVDAPMGGLNERGVVIAQMALIESKYPKYKEGIVLNQLEWIQYQLDNSASVREVIENSKKLRVVPVATPVHYFVCDSLGNTAVIEFLNGELVIHSGKEIAFPVCSNMIYEESKKAIRNYEGFGGVNPIPEKWNSVPDIVAIANSKIVEYQKSNVENPVVYGFEILSAVGSHERTQWSVVYDIKNMKIYFKSLKNRTTRTINFSDFDFSCSGEIDILEIQKSGKGVKSITQFKSLTKEYYFNYKKNIIDWFKSNIPGFPNIPDEAIRLESGYVFGRKCN